MNIEAIHGTDPLCQDPESRLLYESCRGTEQGYIDLPKLSDRAHHRIGAKLRRHLCGVSAYNAHELEVGCHLEGLYGIATDIAVADDCSLDLMYLRHSFFLFLLVKSHCTV